MTLLPIRRAGALLLACAMSLALTGCFLLPGKFNSTLDLRDDGSFTFAYDGQMVFLPLTDEFGDGTSQVDGSDIDEARCFRGDGARRECTAQELMAQSERNAQAAAGKSRADRERAEQLGRLLSGIDPADPEAGNKIAVMLERQRGWDRVVYRGNGVFDVRYRITSRITHDFSFPTIEGMQVASPFVRIFRRDEGAVRIDAPGFAMQTAAGGAMPSGMLMMFGQSVEGNEEAATGRAMAMMEGTFAITTNGEIRANNTDEGAVASGQDRVLSWSVDGTTTDAPTALIQITSR